MQQTLSRSLAAIAGLLLLLSGCMGGGAGPTATGPTAPTFSHDTGAIEGLVLNDEQIPLAGAQVGVQGPEARQTSTDESGRFVFSNLKPGEYTVLVNALGYKVDTRKAVVVPGEPTPLSFTLTSIPIAGLPYKKVHGPLPGKFFCGFSALVAGPCKIIGFSDPNNPLEQQWNSLSGRENNLFEFRDIHKNNRSHPDDEFSQAVVEISWSSTNPSARWLQATIEDLPSTAGARNLTEPDWNRTAGVSPLRMGLKPGMRSYDGKWSVPDPIRGFLVGVFPVADPANPKTPSDVPCPSSAPVCLANRTIGASAYTEQKFEVWITLFYNGDPESKYTALKDE